MRLQSALGLATVAAIIVLAIVVMTGAGFFSGEASTAEPSQETGVSLAASGMQFNEEPVLSVNGVYISSCIMNNTLYVSVSNFCSALGLDAQDSADGQYAAVNDSAVTLTAQIDNSYIECNGRCIYLADGVCSINSSPAVPLVVLTDALGLTPMYIADSNMITVNGDIDPILDADRFYDENDLYWLSRFIYAEQPDGTLEEQVALAEVILNRVASPKYESTVYDVIFAKNEFDVVINGMIYMEPDDTSIIAAKLALEGTELTGGATDFEETAADDTTGQALEIGSYRFYTAA